MTVGDKIPGDLLFYRQLADLVLCISNLPLLASPVVGRTAREWSRAEPRVLVYGWVARKIGKPKS